MNGNLIPLNGLCGLTLSYCFSLIIPNSNFYIRLISNISIFLQTYLIYLEAKLVKFKHLVKLLQREYMWLSTKKKKIKHNVAPIIFFLCAYGVIGIQFNLTVLFHMLIVTCCACVSWDGFISGFLGGRGWLRRHFALAEKVLAPTENIIPPAVFDVRFWVCPVINLFRSICPSCDAKLEKSLPVWL